jgi:hypothetical protein
MDAVDVHQVYIQIIHMYAYICVFASLGFPGCMDSEPRRVCGLPFVDAEMRSSASLLEALASCLCYLWTMF